MDKKKTGLEVFSKAVTDIQEVRMLINTWPFILKTIQSILFNIIKDLRDFSNTLDKDDAIKLKPLIEFCDYFNSKCPSLENNPFMNHWVYVEEHTNLKIELNAAVDNGMFKAIELMINCPDCQPLQDSEMIYNIYLNILGKYKNFDSTLPNDFELVKLQTLGDFINFGSTCEKIVSKMGFDDLSIVKDYKKLNDTFTDISSKCLTDDLNKSFDISTVHHMNLYNSLGKAITFYGIEVKNLIAKLEKKAKADIVELSRQRERVELSRKKWRKNFIAIFGCGIVLGAVYLIIKYRNAVQSTN
jgi:hypothetical protein